jgi:hypothetical protein
MRRLKLERRERLGLQQIEMKHRTGIIAHVATVSSINYIQSMMQQKVPFSGRYAQTASFQSLQAFVRIPTGQEFQTHICLLACLYKHTSFESETC